MTTRAEPTVAPQSPTILWRNALAFASLVAGWVSSSVMIYAPGAVPLARSGVVYRRGVRRVRESARPGAPPRGESQGGSLKSRRDHLLRLVPKLVGSEAQGPLGPGPAPRAALVAFAGRGDLQLVVAVLRLGNRMLRVGDGREGVRAGFERDVV